VLLVLAVFLTGLALAGGLLFQRLEETPLDFATRLALYRDTIAMILARPFLGHGAGTFADAFPLFHSAAVSSNVVWNRAHNVYLQAAAELGLPAFFAFAAYILWWLAKIFAPVQARSRPAPVAIAAIGAAVVVAIHSLFDFSLQIQAVALLMLVLGGAGFGEARRLGESAGFRNGRTAGRGLAPGGEFELRDVEVPAGPPQNASGQNRSNFP
jgi:O-antigen ligase